jgi:hypothetical protein
MRAPMSVQDGLMKWGIGQWDIGAGLLYAVGCAALLASPALRAQPAPPVRQTQQVAGSAAKAVAAPEAPSASSPRTQAPFDPTGYWVSLITQNWRYRMVVPGKGEYADVPINMQAKQIADAWSAVPDEAAGKACEAYGGAIIMRNPERLHISWLDDNTLRVDTDEGMQTRLLHFLPPAVPSPSGMIPAPPQPTVAASWQGHSVAQWILGPPLAAEAAAGTAADQRRSGSLVVNTADLLPGLLRKNGIPYGAATRVREYWDLRRLAAQEWITVSVQVDDPEYLQTPYVYDSIFQKEPDSSRWEPTPCTLGS